MKKSDTNCNASTYGRNVESCCIKIQKGVAFPNCIGATDGKHINIQYPIIAESTYYSYKGSHSIVLLALIYADYKFIAIRMAGTVTGIFFQFSDW